jgi:hypothetical protein
MRRPVIATKRLPGVTERESESIAVISTGASSDVAPRCREPGGAMPAAVRRAVSDRAEPACCTVAVYGRVAAIMPGKKQKGSALSLADALAATRSAHRRVLALAARLEATERTILAAMASAAPVHAAPASASAPAPAKRPVGRPRTRPIAGGSPAPRGTSRATGTRAGTTKRPVGRPKR